MQVEVEMDSNVKANLDEMHETINKQQKERIATMYLRILGNELGYLSLDDLKSLIPVLDRKMITDMVQEVYFHIFLWMKLNEWITINRILKLCLLHHVSCNIWSKSIIMLKSIGLPCCTVINKNKA